MFHHNQLSNSHVVLSGDSNGTPRSPPGGGEEGQKAVRNFSENSSDLVQPPFPNGGNIRDAHIMWQF